MYDLPTDLARLEQLFAGNFISRRQFVHALTGLGLTISGIEGLVGSEASANAAMVSGPVAPHDRYLVVIVMDGFRADYATLAPMHHLRALAARGTRYDTAWVGHLESETPTSHATIATGVYPRKHGVIGFGWRDVASGGFTFMPTDLRLINAGSLTRTIARGGVPTISDLIHARNQHDLAISLSGEKYYASASVGAGADFVLYGKDINHAFRPVAIGPHAPPPDTGYEGVKGDAAFELQDQFATSLAIRLARTLRPRVLFVNLPGADLAGHYYGGMRSPKDMTSTIKGIDHAIGRLVHEYQRLGLLDKTIFVVTADHGMAGNRHIVPIHEMYETAATAAHGTLDEEFRISMGSIWLRHPERDRSVAAAMVAKHFSGVEGSLYKVASGSSWNFDADPSTIAKLPHDLLQAYLNLADTEACPAGPEVILPYHEDTMGLTVKDRKRWGTHGGFSWGVQHVPLIVAGPGVRHSLSHFPAKLVDIAPTVEHLLGLPIPSGVDGVVLADAVSAPLSQERRSQREVTAKRLADVRALAAHSMTVSD